MHPVSSAIAALPHSGNGAVGAGPPRKRKLSAWMASVISWKGQRPEARLRSHDLVAMGDLVVVLRAGLQPLEAKQVIVRRRRILELELHGAGGAVLEPGHEHLLALRGDEHARGGERLQVRAQVIDGE